MKDYLDVKKIVALFGGPTRLVAKINKTPGYAIQLKTVEMWVYRKSIPSRWLILLTRFAKEEQLDFDINKYVVTNVSKEDLEFLS